MFDDPGPLTLIPDDAIPRPAARRDFEAIAAGMSRELQAALSLLEVRGGALAAAAGDSFAARTAATAGAAALSVAGQPSFTPTVPGDVVANVNELETVMAGLLGEVSGDLSTPIPAPPSYPKDWTEEHGTETGPGSTRARLMGLMVSWFNATHGRAPTTAERNQFVDWWDTNQPVSDADFYRWLETTFPKGGDPPDEPPGNGDPPQPPSPLPPRYANSPVLPIPAWDGSGGTGADMRAIYRGYLASDWIPNNFGRQAEGWELDLIDKFDQAVGRIFNAGYNWIIDTYFVPRK